MSKHSAGKIAEDLLIEIAHLSIQIHCTQANLTRVLRERYRDFLSTPSSANFAAEIRWTGEETSQPFSEIALDFQGGILNFYNPNFEGFIDEKKGRGSFTFNSARPVDDIDYYLRMVFALQAHAAGGVLLHAAGIVREEKAYLFYGHSGSGKTTVCRVSQPNYPVLNDDLIILLPDKNGWRAFGTPFWNPTQVQPSSRSAQVAGLYLLVQAQQVFTKPLTAGRGLASLIANVPVIPQDPVRSKKLLEILWDFQLAIPIFELHFLPDNSFWNVISV